MADRIKYTLWERLKWWWYVKVRGYESRMCSGPALHVRSPNVKPWPRDK